MQNLLIHIGYHKTGSTWLQKELFISSNSVFEPLSNQPHGHSSVSFKFIKGEDGYVLSSFNDNQKVIKKECDTLCLVLTFSTCV